MSDDADDKPLVESIGSDRADLMRQWIRSTREQLEEDRPKAREAAENRKRAAQYGAADELWFRVTRTHPRVLGVPCYVAECISGLPDHSMRVRAEESSPEDAVHEARWAYACALYQAKVEPDMDTAKARAARAVLLVEPERND